MASTRSPEIASRQLAEVWGESMRERRLRLGLSTADVASLVGISSQAIWQFEKGKRIPLDRTKVALARALGTTPAELFPWPPMEDLVGDAA